MAAETVKQLGTIDILVKRAGIIIGLVAEFTEGQWDRVMTNERHATRHGTFSLFQGLHLAEERNKEGAIINTASICGRVREAFRRSG